MSGRHLANTTKIMRKSQSAAFHEAGHAVAAFMVGMRTVALSIAADGESVVHHRSQGYFARMNPDLEIPPRVRRRLENGAWRD